jgi:hypothetical protein
MENLIQKNFEMKILEQFPTVFQLWGKMRVSGQNQAAVSGVPGRKNHLYRIMRDDLVRHFHTIINDTVTITELIRDQQLPGCIQPALRDMGKGFPFFRCAGHAK